MRAGGWKRSGVTRFSILPRKWPTTKSPSLPAAIAEELKQHGKVIPRHHDAVTILFADFKGFTRLAEAMEPAALIQLLDEYFTKFDAAPRRRRAPRLDRRRRVH
jgi:class 3 adenylate cyclase